MQFYIDHFIPTNMKTLRNLAALLAIFAAASLTGCHSPRGATTLSDDGRYPEYFGGHGNRNNTNDYVPRNF
jgi:N-formylglutamate amidohydrolase